MNKLCGNFLIRPIDLRSHLLACLRWSRRWCCCRRAAWDDRTAEASRRRPRMEYAPRQEQAWGGQIRTALLSFTLDADLRALDGVKDAAQ